MTDIIGFLLIIPITRKLFIGIISSKINKKNKIKEDFIEGDFEEIKKKDENFKDN